MKINEAIAAIQKNPKSIDTVMDQLTEEVSLPNGQQVLIAHGILAGNKGTVVGPANNGYYVVKTEDNQEMPLPAIFLSPM